MIVKLYLKALPSSLHLIAPAEWGKDRNPENPCQYTVARGGIEPPTLGL
jgi:hypothetical protein